ncbi:MAG: protein-L-isoaspartate(D-aspartate) O-methyltransferase [Elusimicrobia bacterium]|nr:protein-L-isoaspartate(D-aspartate) O-methyltransferase [Elusimicrobiota bacterium]
MADADEARYADLRRRMVEDAADYSAAHPIRDRNVLDAMLQVPRHEFVSESLRHLAYADMPLAIGEGQTISQPFMVAYMIQLLELKPADRVLEVGTGSGYQTAILSRLAGEVFTVEIHESLSRDAAARLERLGCANVRTRIGDGSLGWPEAAPFDAIIATCAPARIPPPLLDQLKTGGRMVIPVGTRDRLGGQELVLARKTAAGTEFDRRMEVRFVPMTGRSEAEPAS